MRPAKFFRAAVGVAVPALVMTAMVALTPGTGSASALTGIHPAQHQNGCYRQLIGTVSSPGYLEASAPSAGTYSIEYDITGSAYFDTYVNNTELGYVGGSTGIYHTRTFSLSAGGVLVQVAGPEGSGKASVYLDQACGSATGEIHAAGAGKCLDVPNITHTEGTQADIWNCNGGSNQEWTSTSSGQLTVYSGGDCLNASGQGTTPGTAVGIRPCNGGASQQWSLNSNGTITGVQSGLCLDVTHASTTDGALAELWTCNGGASQQWTGP